MSEKKEQPEEPIWTTRDFSLACYMFSRGVKLKKFERVPQMRNQHTFYFVENFVAEDGTPRACDQLAIDFINSEAYRFDSAQRALKKLCMNNR